MPVAVPEPGEYVGLGAARQAAWVLDGGEAPPQWAVRIETTLDPPADGSGAAVLERYTALQATVHPS